ncbi:MAG: hypothetical protein ACYDAN_06860 [Candidatus Limnocylindrales bacterium]
MVWVDDAGVTCRRWNWRQCTRTRLTPATTRALFIVDALGPDSADIAGAAAADLDRRLRTLGPGVSTGSRTLPTRP